MDAQALAPTQVQSQLLKLHPGRITELAGPPGMGLTRLGMRLLADHSRVGPVVVIDTRGWVSPLAAWETGVLTERLIVVRCDDASVWPKVAAALFEGVRAVYAEVPARVREQDLRRLGALARARGTAVALRSMGSRLPPGVSHLRVNAVAVVWEGPEQGHGRLERRRLIVEASGKGASGMVRRIEIDEAESELRVVSDIPNPNS